MRCVILAGCAILVVAWAAAACASEGSGLDLRLGHDQPDGHPYDLAVERFTAGVREATGGEVDIRIFPAAQLVDSPEQVKGLYLGTLDMALISGTVVSGCLSAAECNQDAVRLVLQTANA